MLAGAERLDRPFGVAGMRCRNVDGIHFRIVQQSLIAIDDACAWKMIGKAGPVRIAGSNGNQLAGPGMGNAIGKSPGDGAGADDAPADRCRLVHGYVLFGLVLVHWEGGRTGC